MSKRAIRSQSLFCKEQQEKSLPSLLKKELLGIKKGKSSEKLSKTYKNMNFLSESLVTPFLREICLNLEQITHVTLFKERRERFAHGRYFTKNDKSNLLKVALF